MKKSKENKMGMVVIAIVIVIAVVIACIVINKNKQETNQPAPEGPETIVGEDEQQKPDYVETLEDGTSLNKSTKLNETKTVEGLTIEGIQLTSKDSQTLLLANVKNDSKSDTELMEVAITLLDKDNNEIVTLNGLIDPLKVGGTAQLNVSSSLDFSAAYDFKITKK